jgi:hypothetical protein
MEKKNKKHSTSYVHTTTAPNSATSEPHQNVFCSGKEQDSCLMRSKEMQKKGHKAQVTRCRQLPCSYSRNLDIGVMEKKYFLLIYKMFRIL